MQKNFLSLVLDLKGLNMNQAAKLLEWSPQRVGYLCRTSKQGLKLDQLNHALKKLDVSKKEAIKIFSEYLTTIGYESN